LGHVNSHLYLQRYRFTGGYVNTMPSESVHFFHESAMKDERLMGFLVGLPCTRINIPIDI